MDELAAGLGPIRRSPSRIGSLELIVRRPAVDEREVLIEGTLDLEVGLVGDTWLDRGSSSTPDGGAHPDGQLTLMNARAAALIAGPVDRWPLAGDQLYVDLQLGEEELPAGTLIAIGDAEVEITAKPHRGCAKFAARFGRDALRFVNTGEGLTLNLRGRNARVTKPGTVRVSDPVRVIDANEPGRPG